MYNMYAATKRHCSDLPPILSPNTCFQNTNTLPIEMAQIVPGEGYNSCIVAICAIVLQRNHAVRAGTLYFCMG